MVGSLNQLSNISFEKIKSSDAVIYPNGPDNSFGTEDPRAIFREKDKTYYVLYSAVATANDGTPVSRLSLATTKNPQDHSSYHFLGPIFPEEKWSKSGALLIRDGFPGPHYLIWGDSSLHPGIQLATTYNLLNFTNQPGLFIQTRNDSFDSLLVEAGPMPLPLSDGNYLFLYNSARKGYHSIKPNWDIQYNVGWVILDGDNPSKIIQRSDEPLFSPELGWETGTGNYLGLTPNVVFVEGWAPHPFKMDHFVIFYGAADSVVGCAVVSVSKSKSHI